MVWQDNGAMFGKQPSGCCHRNDKSGKDPSAPVRGGLQAERKANAAERTSIWRSLTLNEAS